MKNLKNLAIATATFIAIIIPTRNIGVAYSLDIATNQNLQEKIDTEKQASCDKTAKVSFVEQETEKAKSTKNDAQLPFVVGVEPQQRYLTCEDKILGDITVTFSVPDCNTYQVYKVKVGASYQDVPESQQCGGSFTYKMGPQYDHQCRQLLKRREIALSVAIAARGNGLKIIESNKNVIVTYE